MNIVFFEGIDGAGKTTLVANYHEYLNQSGKN
jgi:thymidylate kinase